MAVYTVLFEKLYTILKQKEPKMLFQNVQNNEINGIFKMLKNKCWINVYYIKRKRL